MTETTNSQAFIETLEQLEELLDNCDADIDYDTISDILTIEFENHSKIIINYQSANGQLWLAARSGGFHYDYDEGAGRWKNDRNGVEFFDQLSELATEQAGEGIILKPE
ncbi:MAG TPA: iron donor protein CyaY [Gammaproteobacteria bacterium]|nr:iron donor protein CyaY [Gammaproteobacteria bacterium]